MNYEVDRCALYSPGLHYCGLQTLSMMLSKYLAASSETSSYATKKNRSPIQRATLLVDVRHRMSSPNLPPYFHARSVIATAEARLSVVGYPPETFGPSQIVIKAPVFLEP